MSAPTEQLKNPGVNFPPPILFVLSALCGVGLESVLPIPLSQFVVIPRQPVIAWSTTLLGGALLLWALRTFVSLKTAVYPNRPAGTLVANGPYRFSRNPMYVAVTLISIGVALLADNLWMLLLLPFVLTFLTKFVIRCEEQYLQAEFGPAYCDYQKRVRRWL